jgi:hypothetical protein
MMTMKKTHDEFFGNNLQRLRSKPNYLKSESFLCNKKAKGSTQANQNRVRSPMPKEDILGLVIIT